MKRAFVMWLMLATGLAVPAQAVQRPAISDVDRILAIVNDDVITETQLEIRVSETRRQLAFEKIALPPDQVLRKQVLERMVMERIQLQLAARLGVRVSEADVDRAVESIAQQNRMSVLEFQSMLRREGFDTDLHRAQVRNQLMIQQLLEREINTRVTVTESEVSSFLENQELRGGVDVEYNLSHIFIPVPESASTEAIQAAKRHTEEIHRQLEQGESFEQAAIANSQGPDALKGGLIGWRRAGQLPELFLTALKTLAPGSVSGVLRSPNGYHILRLNDQRGGAQAKPVTQTHVRHILLRPSEIASTDEVRQKLRILRERVANGEDFAALAKAHSEDTGSAVNGGDVGWVSPGQLVPEFERAMDALQPGELSEPVQSPFGFHLIQVLERRQQDLTDERMRAAARSQIHARKAEERYQQWVRQLRDEAYVEYLLEEVN